MNGSNLRILIRLARSDPVTNQKTPQKATPSFALFDGVLLCVPHPSYLGGRLGGALLQLSQQENQSWFNCILNGFQTTCAALGARMAKVRKPFRLLATSVVDVDSVAGWNRQHRGIYACAGIRLSDYNLRILVSHPGRASTNDYGEI